MLKVSRASWSREQFFSVGLGLTVIGLGLGLGLMQYTGLSLIRFDVVVSNRSCVPRV